MTEYLAKGQRPRRDLCVILRNVIPPRGKWVQKPSKQADRPPAAWLPPTARGLSYLGRWAGGCSTGHCSDTGLETRPAAGSQGCRWSSPHRSGWTRCHWSTRGRGSPGVRRWWLWRKAGPHGGQKMNKSSPSPGILYSYISYVLNVLIRGLTVDQICYRLCLYLEAEIRGRVMGWTHRFLL